MYTRILHVQLQTGKQAAYLQTWKAHVAPHLPDMPGFRAMQVIADQDNPDSLRVISTWDSRDAFDNWHDSDAHSAAREHLREVINSIQREHFDVLASV
jgi:heme-degrading monooxygenase HmoA